MTNRNHAGRIRHARARIAAERAARREALAAAHLRIVGRNAPTRSGNANARGWIVFWAVVAFSSACYLLF